MSELLKNNGRCRDDKPLVDAPQGAHEISYFDHVELDNGFTPRMDRFRVHQGSVSDDDHAAMLPYILSAASGVSTLLPGDGDREPLLLAGSRHGNEIVLMIYACPWGHGNLPVEKFVPIFSVAMSPGGEEGDEIWRTLRDESPDSAADAGQRPPAAWCAKRFIFPQCLFNANAMLVADEVTSAIAWAWFGWISAQHGLLQEPFLDWMEQLEAANDDDLDMGGQRARP